MCAGQFNFLLSLDLLFYEQFSKHLEAGLAKVLAMPKVTLEDAIQRAAAMIRHNAQFRYTPRRG